MEYASKPLRITVSAFLLMWSLIVLFPLYWTFIMSFKNPAAIFGGATFIPWVDFEPSLEHWTGAFSGTTARALTNSAVIAVVSAAVATSLGGMAGYGLSRYRYRFGFMRNDNIAFWMVSQKIMPPVVVVLPLFIMFNTVALIDSPIGMIILYVMFNLPIAAWIMYQYFKQLPTALDEAARIDGASEVQLFRHIAFPVARPGLAATFIVTLVFSWNEFLFALIFTFSNAQTIPILVAGQATQHGPQWWDIAVMSLITVAPLIVITLFMGRKVVGGLLAGWEE